MGLHESLLDVPERLRVWQQAGVRYFYIPSSLVAEDSDEPSPSSDNLDDPASWPAPWPALLAKTPRRPRIVLTYPELGLDLTGRSDPRRSALWRDLIHRLGLSGQGAVAFWPMSVPIADDLGIRLDLYQAGLSVLCPGVVALFGARTAEFYQRLGQTTDPFPCVMLPDLSVLLDGNAEAWDHVLEILSNY